MITINSYVTSSVIRELREKAGLTQAQLAHKLHVSDKTVSKWETGRGLPDIMLLQPLAAALNITLPELLSGDRIVNRNKSMNIKKMLLYVCPVCGNIITAAGDARISCCGIELPPLESDAPDPCHMPSIEPVEDEYFVSLSHDMTRDHYISFIAFASYDRFELKKLYPEGNPETRISLRGGGTLYWYCNRHGLFSKKI